MGKWAFINKHYVESGIGKTVENMDLVTGESGEFMCILFSDNTFTLVYGEDQYSLNTVERSDLRHLMKDDALMQSTLECIQ